MTGTELDRIYTGFNAYLLPYPYLVGLILVSLPIAALVGFQFGAREYRRRNYHKVASEMVPGGTSLGAMLALLGLLLGFAFSSALGWRETRQTALVEEAMAISTAYLTADLLKNPGRDALQTDILNYAKTRVATAAVVTSREDFTNFLIRSLEAQSKIWPTTLRALEQDVSDPIRTAVAGRVTEMLDAHTKRAAAAALQIPPQVRTMVFVVAVAAIFIVGNRSALQGRKLTWRTFAFSTVLAVVMLVIFDIDRTLQGSMQINYDTLRATIYDMETMRAAASN